MYIGHALDMPRHALDTLTGYRHALDKHQTWADMRWTCGEHVVDMRWACVDMRCTYV